MITKFQNPAGVIDWTFSDSTASPSLQRARLYGVTQKPEVAEEQVSEEGQKNRDYARRKAAYMEEVARVQDGTRPFVGQLSPGQDFIYTGMPITSTFSIADDMSKSAQLIGPAIKNGQWGAAVGNALKIPSGLVLGAASLVPGVGLAKNIVADAVKGTRFVATHNPLYYYNASKPLTKGVRYMPNEKGGYTLLNTKGNHLAFPEKGAQVQPSEFGDWFARKSLHNNNATGIAREINKENYFSKKNIANAQYAYKDLPNQEALHQMFLNLEKEGKLYFGPRIMNFKSNGELRRSPRVHMITGENGIPTELQVRVDDKVQNAFKIHVPSLEISPDFLQQNLQLKIDGIPRLSRNASDLPQEARKIASNFNKQLQQYRKLSLYNPDFEYITTAVNKQPYSSLDFIIGNDGSTKIIEGKNLVQDAKLKRLESNMSEFLLKRLNESSIPTINLPEVGFDDLRQILKESPQYISVVKNMLAGNPSLSQEEIIKNLLQQRFRVVRGMNTMHNPNLSTDQLIKSSIKIPDDQYGGRADSWLFPKYDDAKQDILYTSNSLPTAYSYTYPEEVGIKKRAVTIIERDPSTFNLTGTPLDWWHNNKLNSDNVIFVRQLNSQPVIDSESATKLANQYFGKNFTSLSQPIQQDILKTANTSQINPYGHILFLGDRGSVPTNMLIKDNVVFKTQKQFENWLRSKGYDFSGEITRQHWNTPSLGFTLGDKHGGTLKQINYLDLFKQKQK